jgi:hypothetical protein
MEKIWKVVFAFVAVFMAGSVFGGFFALRIGRQMAPRERPGLLPVAARPALPQPPPAMQLMRRFAERLELTEEQRVRLRPIILGAEEQLARMRQTSLEQTDAIIRRVQQEVREELTPAQRRMLDRMQQAQSENLRRERLNRQQLAQPNGPPGTQPGGPGRPGIPNRPQNQFRDGQRPLPNQPGANQPRPPNGPPRLPPENQVPPDAEPVPK